MKVTITPEAGDTLVIPDHPEGGEWSCSLGHGQGQLTFADTASELIGVIIPGYTGISHDDDGHDEALWQRHNHCLQLAAQAQSGIIGQAVDRGDLDTAAADEDTLTALMQDRADAWSGVRNADGTVSRDWAHKVPLVQVATVYAPFTDVAVPTGRIIWLDPSLETTYLASLAALGLVDYRTKQG